RPVAEHLVDVGEDLARAPVGLGLGPVGGAERPGLPGDERAAQCEKVGAGVMQPTNWIVHAPVSHVGVAWVVTPSRPRAGSPFRGRPPRAQPLATGRRTAGDGNMTETIPRGAANQAGAHLNKNAYEEAQDFLPLKGIDHVEFWVGNARQSAHYFRALWGFTPIAYAGL